MRILTAAAFTVALGFACSAFAQKYPTPKGLLTTSTGCNPYDYTFTSTANTSVTVVPANGARVNIALQVPSALTGGLYIEFAYNPATGLPLNASTTSMLFPAGTALLSLPASFVGYGPIAVYATTAGVVVPFKECQ